MYEVKDGDWKIIYSHLRTYKSIYTKNEEKTRLFFNAVLYVNRTGCQWRALPEKFGDWSAVYRRFADWSRKGIWAQIFTAVSADCDKEYVMMDSTVVRAHACAAGAPKKTEVTTMRL